VKKLNSGFAHIILIILLTTVTIGAVVFLSTSKQSKITSTPSLESGWKTYINTTYNYKVSYPTNWHGTSKIVNDNFRNELFPDAYEVGFYPDKMSDKASASVTIRVLDTPPTYPTQSEIIINSQKAMVYSDKENDDYGNETYLFNTGSSGYIEVELSFININLIDINKTTLDQILSTFEFMPKVSKTLCTTNEDCEQFQCQTDTSTYNGRKCSFTPVCNGTTLICDCFKVCD